MTIYELITTVNGIETSQIVTVRLITEPNQKLIDITPYLKTT